MLVAVHEPGEQGSPLEVDDLRGAFRERLDLPDGSNLENPPSFDCDRLSDGLLSVNRYDLPVDQNKVCSQLLDDRTL